MEAIPPDIDLVLITGAGASAPFGVGGNRLVQMQGWSDALCKKLRGSDYNYLALTGLSDGLDGPTFEERLGDYLRKVEAFNSIESFIGLSASFVNLSPAVAQQSLDEWYGALKFKLKTINNLIHESLYEPFALGGGQQGRS